MILVDHGGLADIVISRLTPEFSDISIAVARSVPEALEMLEGNSYDAILCCSDLGSSSMTGIDLLEWLRNSGSRIPFVLITRESGKDIAIRALNLGADLYLRKDIEETEDVLLELISYLRNRMETKRHQDLVIESEAKFRHLFESAMDGIIATDMRGDILQYNESFARLIGTDLESLIGKSFAKVVPSELLPQAQQVGLQVQQIGYSELFEFELITSDKERVPVLLSAWRRDNADSIPIGSWVWIRDISDKKVVEEEKWKSEAKFYSIFHDSPVAIAFADKEGLIQEVNEECLRIFRLKDHDAAKGYSMFDDPVLPEEVKDSLARGEKAIFRTSYSFDPIEGDEIHNSSRGRKASFRVFAAPLFDQDLKTINGFIFQMIEESDTQ
ncbi:MAG: PAS domain S-box protein [Candidatus Thorarchaeota archaeon]